MIEEKWKAHKGTFSFKPYYKWITFNIKNLYQFYLTYKYRFKPYYKWITFNIILI